MDEAWLLARRCELEALITEVEGMKAANSQYPQDQPYSENKFNDKAREMRCLAEQIWKER